MKRAETLKDFICDEAQDWIFYKNESLRVAGIYESFPAHRKKAKCIRACAEALRFREDVDSETGVVKYILISAMFCRKRYCPICQWRRRLKFYAIFHQAIPMILAQLRPSSKLLFLTFTRRTCPVTELRSTLQIMRDAYNRMADRKKFKLAVDGWFRTIGITNTGDGTAHPHFHCLLALSPTYSGVNYISNKEWASLWHEALKMKYDERIYLEKVGKSKGDLERVLRYCVRKEDIYGEPDWFITLTEQTHCSRFVAQSGIIKDILKTCKSSRGIKIDELGADSDGLEFWWDAEGEDYNILDI